jgi:3'-5' exoribonuclease
MSKEILNKKINEFENGDLIEGFFLLKNLQTKENKNGKKYLDLDLSDKTGDINSKYWNVKTEELEIFSPEQLLKSEEK